MTTLEAIAREPRLLVLFVSVFLLIAVAVTVSWKDSKDSPRGAGLEWKSFITYKALQRVSVLLLVVAIVLLFEWRLSQPYVPRGWHNGYEGFDIGVGTGGG